MNDDVVIKCGDAETLFNTIEDNSIDLVLTDPPYEAKYSHVWSILGRESARVLRTGGSMVTLLGHYQVPEVTAELGKHLRYWWIGGMSHDTLYRMPGKWVCVRWKPALWYVKERRRPNDYECPMDLSDGGGKDKTHHKWGQPVSWFEHWIERLCPEGGTVLDPFLGGGTTGIACKNTGRDFIGFELDPDIFNVAKERLG